MRNDWDRIQNILTAAENVAVGWEAKSRIQDIQIHSGYAEPSYTGELVATGNWNSITKWDRNTNTSVVVDDTIHRVATLLEKMGFTLEWSDEWTTCSDCGLLVRTQADSYSWQPSFTNQDGDIICLNCLDPADHLSNLEGNEKSANQITTINPADYDYIKVDDYEHGWYPGQNASPKLIASALRNRNIERFVFNMDSVGQFDQHFSVWVHESEYDLLNDESLTSQETDGPDNASKLKQQLADASVAMSNLTGTGIKYANVNLDGSVSAKMVSPENFVNGKF
jgi:hypothetical protein